MLNVLTKIILPTYPNFLGHETGTTHIFHLGHTKKIINFLKAF